MLYSKLIASIFIFSNKLISDCLLTNLYQTQEVVEEEEKEMEVSVVF